MGVMRRLVVATATVLVVGAATAASPTSRIGPNEHFAGLVNGSTGQSQPAVIRMACFGPIVPEQKGHPFAGQTLEVRHRGPSPSATSTDVGITGSHGRQVGVFFGPPPPGSTTNPVTFRAYGVVKAIPTSVLLPCAGTGTVPFIPIPVVRGSHEAVVPVVYVGQP